jgi:hypothetical protein
LQTEVRRDIIYCWRKFAAVRRSSMFCGDCTKYERNP